MSKLLEQLKSGKSIKDILAEEKPTEQAERLVTPLSKRGITLPSLPPRPSILEEKLEDDQPDDETYPLENDNETLSKKEETPPPISKPENAVTFDVGKLKNIIIETLTKSITTSYALIQYLSDETGIPVEQIMKVILDMLKDSLKIPSVQIQTEENGQPTAKPKLAFPGYQTELPENGKDDDIPEVSEGKKLTLQERALKDKSGQQLQIKKENPWD